MFNWKVFVAEFIGTFALVFVGAASGMYNVGLLGVALAHGLTLAVFAYVFGHVSGTHVNPAVTFGLAANGNIKWGEAVVYWVAQFSGAAFAAFLLKTLVGLVDPNAFTAMATRGVLSTDEFRFYAMGVEALLTFFLVNTVLHAAVDGKAGPFGGWAVGTTLAIAILAGGPLTGASLNPARSFGPALFTSLMTPGVHDALNLNFYLIYFMGPLIGATLATMLYQAFKSEPVVIEPIEVEEEAVMVKTPVKKPVVRKTTPRKTTKK